MSGTTGGRSADPDPGQPAARLPGAGESEAQESEAQESGARESGARESDVRHQIGQAVRELLRVAPAVHSTLAGRLTVGPTDLTALDVTTSSATPLGVVELSQRLGIRSASTTVLVDRLVASGHLQRQPHPSDRRRTSLSATQSAYHDIRAALGPLIRDLTAITDELDAEAAATVLAFLRTVIATLDGFVAGTAGE
ncbi:MAG: MarR family transcriptional regulator [Actinomycetota bacterium]|nr:MarR family transcriptional regulator [Actinomycetota bacterium]